MMTARRFILGVLSRHLPTKVLSLLLAVVLFLFVAARQTEDMQIRELKVQLRLAEGAREGYILRTDVLDLGGMVTIRGQRSEVEGVRVRISGHELVRGLGPEDLAALMPPNVVAYSIEVDAELLYRLKILPPETIQVREIDRSQKNPTIDIVRRKTLTMAISVSDESKTALLLSPNSAWVSPGGENRVTAKFEPGQVRIAGPEDIISTWGDGRTLPVVIRDVNTILDERGATPGRIVRDDIRDVDWPALGVGAQKEFFTLSAPKKGPIDLLKDEIELVFEIRPKEEQYKLPPLPVNLRLQSGAGYKFEDEFTVRPQHLDYASGKIKLLKVLGPKSVLRDNEFMNRLVAVVDVANATPDGGRLIAFVELDLSGVKDSADRDKLHQLKLLPTDGKMPALLLEKK
ncbi:MAG: hypothetical protein V3T86_06940 [Planctomycetota bacterium]